METWWGENLRGVTADQGRVLGDSEKKKNSLANNLGKEEESLASKQKSGSGKRCLPNLS